MTITGHRVSLWDLTDEDVVKDGRGYDMPRAFATTQGAKQWREFIEPLQWGQWDAVTVWADWKGLKPGDTLDIEEFRADYCGRWRDLDEYRCVNPSARCEDYDIRLSRVLIYSSHFFKKTGEQS